MEMNMGKFSEKLVELLEFAKKKKNVLEYQEINDFFKDTPLDTEQLEKVFDFLEASGIDVLRISDSDVDEASFWMRIWTKSRRKRMWSWTRLICPYQRA